MDPVWPTYFQPDVVREAFGTKLSSFTLAVEAWRRGLSVTFCDTRLNKIRISQGPNAVVQFIESRPSLTSREAHLTAKNKYKSNQLLRAAGLAVPKSVHVDPRTVDVNQLRRHAEEIGYPVVLKPRDGAMGQGVFANIPNSTVLEERYRWLREASGATRLVLESHVPGDDYRVLVFGGQYIAACQRVPANVTGDGVSTVDQLIASKNQYRRKNPFLSKGLIRKDQEVSDYLRQAGYSYQSIPTAGENLRLRSAANASAGGDVVDVTDQLPESIRESSVRAAQAVPGLYCAGVDVLYERTAANSNEYHHVLELNGQPQIGVNMYPTHGTGVDVPKRVIDICFPDSEAERHPGDEKLTLRLRPSLQPIVSGHVSEVVVAPLPSSRYQTRRLYDLATTVKLTYKQRSKILWATRKHALAGFLINNKNAAQLMVAGRPEQLDRFAAFFASVTAAELGSPDTWSGPVRAGFLIEA